VKTRVLFKRSGHSRRADDICMYFYNCSYFKLAARSIICFMIKLLYLILNAFFLGCLIKYIIDSIFQVRNCNVYIADAEYSFYKSQIDLPVRFLVTLINNSLTIFRSNANNVEADI
jgi:hypothetical protein